MLNIVCLFIPFPLDFEEPAALVECGVKMFVFMPASFRVSFSQVEMVAVVTGECDVEFERKTFVFWSSLHCCVLSI